MGHTGPVAIDDHFNNTPVVDWWYWPSNVYWGRETWGTRQVRHYREDRPISAHSPRDSVGWRAPRPFYHRNLVAHATCSSWKRTPTSGSSSWVAAYYDYALWNLKNTEPGDIWLPDYRYLEDNCITQALLRLKNQRIDLGVAFAERRDTARLFQNKVSGITQSVNDYKKGRPRDWKRVKRGAIPSSWLEVQLGWLPLLSDIHGAAQALAERDARGNRYVAHVTGRAEARNSSRHFIKSGVSADLGYDVNRTENVRGHVRLDYELSDIVLQTLSSLGLTNPLTIAWERLPYSFVVDYLLPIGDWISCLDANLGWSFRGGSYSLRVSIEERGGNPYLRTPEAGFDWQLLSVTEQYRGTRDELHRSIYPSSPLPTVPRFRNPFTPGRTANVLALLAQALERQT